MSQRWCSLMTARTSSSSRPLKRTYRPSMTVHSLMTSFLGNRVPVSASTQIRVVSSGHTVMSTQARAIAHGHARSRSLIRASMQQLADLWFSPCPHSAAAFGSQAHAAVSPSHQALLCRTSPGPEFTSGSALGMQEAPAEVPVANEPRGGRNRDPGQPNYFE